MQCCNFVNIDKGQEVEGRILNTEVLAEALTRFTLLLVFLSLIKERRFPYCLAKDSADFLMHLSVTCHLVFCNSQAMLWSRLCNLKMSIRSSQWALCSCPTSSHPPCVWGLRIDLVHCHQARCQMDHRGCNCIHRPLAASGAMACAALHTEITATVSGPGCQPAAVPALGASSDSVELGWVARTTTSVGSCSASTPTLAGAAGILDRDLHSASTRGLPNCYAEISERRVPNDDSCSGLATTSIHKGVVVLLDSMEFQGSLYLVQKQHTSTGLGAFLRTIDSKGSVLEAAAAWGAVQMAGSSASALLSSFVSCTWPHLTCNTWKRKHL
jgi:hypothetical protein